MLSKLRRQFFPYCLLHINEGGDVLMRIYAIAISDIRLLYLNAWEVVGLDSFWAWFPASLFQRCAFERFCPWSELFGF
jgi:hypothetical protein